MSGSDRPGVSSSDIASYVIAGAALLLTLTLHLVPALISGLFVYELVHILAPLLPLRRLSGTRARLVVVTLLATLIILLLASAVWGIVLFFHSRTDNMPALLHKMAEIIEGGREKFPPWLSEYLPGNTEGAQAWMVSWLRGHAGELQVMGKEAGRVAAHILVGMITGALISLRELTPLHRRRPLAKALAERADRLSRAFRSVVFAQVRIAALNTLFAGLYLGIVLPLAGIHLPLMKSMIAITFVAGLLPVIGNLLSNSVIVVVSLSHSFSVAIASLVFLVVIHKVEYFLNARIVGSRINARAWELLLAMLVMEAAFGIAGLIVAPIYYAYIKGELIARGLI